MEWVLVYVREAHPGDRLHQHKNYEEKKAASKLVKPRYNGHRRVLVDTHDGDVHKAYAMMPNILYVVRPDGTIHYRCNWATAEDLDKALTDRDKLHTYENADIKKLKAARRLYTTIRTMWTGGFLALYDFVKAGPDMAVRHQKVDAFYRENGKFNKKPGLFSDPAMKKAQEEAAKAQEQQEAEKQAAE